MDVQASDLEYAEAWDPDTGEVLAGEVIEITTRTSEFGTYPIITIRKEDGEEKAFHAFHTVARNELARIAPQVGNKVAILYKGKASRPEGRDFEDYRAKALDAEPRPFDWTNEQRAAGEDPTPVSEDGELPKLGEPSEEKEDIPF